MYEREGVSCRVVPLNVIHTTGDYVRVEPKVGHAAKVLVAVEVVQGPVPNDSAVGRGGDREASI